MSKLRGFPGGKGNGSGDDDIVLELPNLEELKRRFRESGGGGGKRLRIIGLVVLVLMAVFTSAFTIEPEEVGVVLRFGEFQRYASPGLNLKIPFGVEEVIKVPVERQLKEEFGFRSEQVGVRTRYASESFDEESLMLTGDLNIADVEWVVQYRIVDPYKYLFRVRGVHETFRGMSEAVMREVVGDRTVNEVLTVGRAEIATLVETDLQALADQYETGLKVEQVVLQNVNPPDEVKASFNEVNQAEQERSSKINAAQSQYNERIPRARGEAEQMLSQAEGYALERTNRAEGEANRFNALYGEYRSAPEVTRKRLYLETMGKVLPRAGGKIVVDQGLEGLVPMFNMDTTGRGSAGSTARQGGVGSGAVGGDG